MPEDFLDTKEKRVLELDVRRKVYEIVRKYAGCHFREIQRKSKLSIGSIKYHLDYLEKNKLIKSQKETNNLRYYPKEFQSQNTQLMGLLRQEKIRQIILFILLNKNCTQEKISENVQLSSSTTSWHLKKLEEAKILRSTKIGRIKKYILLIDEKELVKLLITYKESFLDELVDNVIKMWE
jgi:predicted transcriptional regulator